MQLLILLPFFVGGSLAREVDFCYAQDDEPYVYTSSKTPYEFVSTSSRLESIPNCQPQQIWMMAKHGSRYPSKKKIMKLQNTLPKLRDQIIDNHERRKLGRMCNEDLDNLKAWSLDSKIEETAQKLTAQGIEDGKLLARRLQSDFPELLQPNVLDITAQNYVFKSTGSDSAQSSSEAFIEGLFGRKNVIHFRQDPAVSLVKYKNCSHWIEGDDEDPSPFEEPEKFFNGSEFLNVIQNISHRIGFKYDLSRETIQLMYDMCRFDKSWALTSISPWCAVFNKEELKVLEYSEDLIYYYKAGYGRAVNSQIGCFPLQDMYNNFREIERGDTNGKPRGLFYFTHTTAMLTFLTTMGIAKDDTKLSSSNYREMSKRLWKTSLISPLNSNLLAVFYRCNDVDSPNKVMLYLQERPVLYEGCQVGLCDWEYLKNKFEPIVSQCDPEFCTTGNGSISQQTLISFSIILIMVFTSININSLL